MKRYKKYNKINTNNDYSLLNQCKNIVNKLVDTTPLSTKDVYWVLSVRLRIKPEDCILKNFDELMLTKVLKQLELMLEISLE